MKQTQYRVKTKAGLVDPSHSWYMPQVKHWHFPFWIDMESVGEIDLDNAIDFLRNNACPKPPAKSKVVWTGTKNDLCKKGFTLIELLVVVAVVGIIITAIIAGVRGGDSCSFYKYSPMREVPANCYSYFMESK